MVSARSLTYGVVATLYLWQLAALGFDADAHHAFDSDHSCEEACLEAAPLSIQAPCAADGPCGNPAHQHRHHHHHTGPCARCLLSASAGAHLTAPVLKQFSSPGHTWLVVESRAIPRSTGTANHPSRAPPAVVL